MTREAGNFFILDRRSYAKVCELGENPAVAYLVLACGTEHTNRYSHWSIQAVEKYTGISRTRATVAIRELNCAGFIIQRNEANGRPVYELPTWEEIVKVNRLVLSPSTDPGLGRHLVWLPKTLIVGAADETPGIERVRQTHDPMTLRLLVDLYSVHELPEEMGVKRDIVWRDYKRERIGRWAEFDIWGFKAGLRTVSWRNAVTLCHKQEILTKKEKKEGKTPATDFFRRLDDLEVIGLVEEVPCLFDGDENNGEPLFPYYWNSPTDLERQIARTVYEASSAMLTENQRAWADRKGFAWFAAFPRHCREIQMFGIFRLRHQPHTAKTGKWWRDLNIEGEKLIAQYRSLAERVAKSRSAVA